ncbi:ABC transporter permease [Albimonas pacifica]|uniref:Putative hydroxymethylpyrimidine transport system permease protein n=1 Tax=Albimonas pacifica TaxID=1114924 RepID=A0A1I3K1T1_9RHOB|nr:ABC transporter permease [Albimonas pacifica]SFI66386.1 putative hydroxymethylpyrimidine transport system permease protein [Albimonas pacifica]
MRGGSATGGLFAAAVLLAVWQGVVWATGAAPFILPSPLRVAQALWTSRALIAEHGVVTLAEVLAGLLLGAILGAGTAIQLALSPIARRLLLPALVFMQAVPVFALAPILTLWLGYGIGSKILMTVLIIYFPVTSAFYDGLRRTDPALLDLSAVMGGTRWSELWRLRVPAALPDLASGLRLAAVYAPIGAVIGEWVGASKGLGYLMLLANGRAKTDLMFAALFVLALGAVALYVLLGIAARRLERWSRTGR